MKERNFREENPLSFDQFFLLIKLVPLFFFRLSSSSSLLSFVFVFSRSFFSSLSLLHVIFHEVSTLNRTWVCVRESKKKSQIVNYTWVRIGLRLKDAVTIPGSREEGEKERGCLEVVCKWVSVEERRETGVWRREVSERWVPATRFHPLSVCQGIKRWFTIRSLDVEVPTIRVIVQCVCAVEEGNTIRRLVQISRKRREQLED